MTYESPTHTTNGRPGHRREVTFLIYVYLLLIRSAVVGHGISLVPTTNCVRRIPDVTSPDQLICSTERWAVAIHKIHFLIRGLFCIRKRGTKVLDTLFTYHLFRYSTFF